MTTLEKAGHRPAATGSGHVPPSRSAGATDSAWPDKFDQFKAGWQLAERVLADLHREAVSWPASLRTDLPEVEASYRTWLTAFHIGNFVSPGLGTGRSCFVRPPPAFDRFELAGQLFFWAGAAQIRDLVLRQGLVKITERLGNRRPPTGPPPLLGILESGPTHLMTLGPALRLLRERGISLVILSCLIDDRRLAPDQRPAWDGQGLPSVVLDAWFEPAQWLSVVHYRLRLLQRVLRLLAHPPTGWSFFHLDAWPFLAPALCRHLVQDLPTTLRYHRLARSFLAQVPLTHLLSPIDGLHRHSVMIREARARGLPTLQFPHGFLTSDWFGLCYVPLCDELLVWTPGAIRWLPRMPNFVPRCLREIPPAIASSKPTPARPVDPPYEAVVLGNFRSRERYEHQLREGLRGLRDAGLTKIGLRCHPQEPTLMPGVAQRVIAEFPGVDILPSTLTLPEALSLGALVLNLQSTSGLEARFLGLPTICLVDPTYDADPFYTDGTVGQAVTTAAEITALIRRGVPAPTAQPWTRPQDVTDHLTRWIATGSSLTEGDHQTGGITEAWPHV